MSHKSDKYGTYYGVLTNYKDNPDLIYVDWEDTPKQMEKLYKAGVTEIFFDVEDGDDYSCTLYFATDERTNYKELMKIIVGFHPDEFSEEFTNHFRMWFD